MIQQCIYCNDRDQKVPVTSSEPCDRCILMMSVGFTVLECDTKPVYENQLPLAGDREPTAYPTGNYAVFTGASANKAFADEGRIPLGGVSLCTIEQFKDLTREDKE